MNELLLSILFISLIILFFIFFIYVCFVSYKEYNLKINIYFIIFVLLICVSFLYFSIYLFLDTDKTVFSYYFLLFFTFTNITGIILSYHYFYRTGCHDHEGNVFGRYLYNTIGFHYGHIILLCLKIAINVIISYLLLSDQINVFENNNGIYYYWMIICIITSTYLLEVLFNIISNSDPIEKCNDISLLCKKSLQNIDIILDNNTLDNSLYFLQRTCPVDVVEKTLQTSYKPSWYKFILKNKE